MEYLGANSFKVLKNEEIVRRPGGRAPKAAAKPESTPAPVAVAAAPAPATVAAVSKKQAAKKPTGKASQIP